MAAVQLVDHGFSRISAQISTDFGRFATGIITAEEEGGGRGELLLRSLED